ncbi:DUF4238 domain-containing protein [Yersinia enterocolitica]|uniref:DUF4238 domain-containing protein n=1 Tax=Yersinia enterocolitica TaxID=630 RepID=UPI0021E8936B|nr:DUF4238 domain-containing protein [Yersinia enterocolitica]MCV3311249.1 DUF4238 domain-containing protein [Yersinia enterocolitica]UYJ88390.1 DUF4238 domain-containing protein [Yersinia enterocolitica]UYJ92379.1 DUF4238 domain-containing protein [Yersinia enterocolitica]UYK21897.1 DUF4238 domain-containing protein [Yersinia enterocolitica]UYK25007.1 DUF4238 domain-containing protein [Yersinia enterocolitica]
MANKTKQHLVPACYLKNFKADVSKEKITNPNYESGIFVNDKKLSSGWKLKSVRHKSLTKHNYYNIAGDDPNNPVIENYLSVVETHYNKYFIELRNERIDDTNMSFMSYFMAIQYMRVEAFIEPNQTQWDTIGGWLDDIEGGDSYKIMFKDFVKKQLIHSNLGNIPYQHSTIIYNLTAFPFITSDNPVVKLHLNITDALKIIPERYLIEFENKSSEFSFFFFPLSPKIAYISFELLRGREKFYYRINDLEKIFYLNIHSLYNSYSKVFSSIIEPIKGESKLSAFLSSPDNNKTIIKIYTINDRVISNGYILHDEDYVITLKLDSLYETKKLKGNEKIKKIEIIKDDISIRGMKECHISSINYDERVVVVESDFNFGT